MDLQKTKLFESLAFEVTEYQNVYSYNVVGDKLSVNEIRDAVIKQIEVILYDSRASQLIVLTDQPIKNKTIQYTINGQSFTIVFDDIYMSWKSKLELLFNHAIEFSESIIRVSDKLYFIATETFLSHIRKDEKSKIYPFFKFEILEVENKVLIIIQLMLYSQNYPNLMKALEEDYLHKASTLD